MKINFSITNFISMGLALSLSSFSFAQNPDSNSLLILPGIWKADVSALNHAEQSTKNVGKELICIKGALTTKDALISTFLQKYTSSQCSFSDVEEHFRTTTGNNDFKRYSTNMTCGAMSGPTEISVFDTGGNNNVIINVKLSGEIKGTRYGDDVSTKFNWEHVSHDCE